MSAPTPDETILGLLAAQAQHGYHLLEAFNDPARLGNVWNLSTSQIYAVLKRLHTLGWITAERHESDHAPARVEYALTQHGWDHLHNWLNQSAPSPSIRRVRVEFLSRLYIATILNLPIRPIIDRQRATCQAERTRLFASQRNTPAGFGSLATDLWLAQLDAILQWIDHCETTLES